MYYLDKKSKIVYKLLMSNEKKVYLKLWNPFRYPPKYRQTWRKSFHKRFKYLGHEPHRMNNE